MVATSGDLAAAQQAYVAPGQPTQQWLERTAILLQQFGQDLAAIRPLLQSSAAVAALDEVDRYFKTIVTLDSQARQDIREAQTLLAADRIFGESRDTSGRLMATLRALQRTEQDTSSAQRTTVEWQQWGAVDGIAALWVIGLLVLVRVPRAATAEPRTATREVLNLEPVNDERKRSAPPAVDLAAAAEVCGVLARTTDAASLRDALARVAAVLDACGIIVWMGAGEELFPALAHGYDERVLERLGPIPRNAANATADAWRTAHMRTVPSDPMSHGALAVPVSGVSGCVGVFTAEVRHGREEDAGTRAVASMIAAQLAGIVSAWPAASTSDHAHKTA
jgi:hypothetical protein